MRRERILFRGERLVARLSTPLANGAALGVAVQDFGFDNIKLLSEFMDELANAMLAITEAQDVMLWHVILFSNKVLDAFLDIHCPKIMPEFAVLAKRRDRYDATRLKKSDKLQTAKQQLREQASIMDALLKAMFDNQMNVTKSVDVYGRAECHYVKGIQSVLTSLNPPDY